VAAGLLLHDVYWLLAGITRPVLGFHEFRQSQTAISAYWLAHGGPWLAYETPIVGAPWSIPFEFPLYQWLVALLSFTGLSIDVSGRLVAFAFFVACLVPMRMLSRQFRLPDTAFLFAAILFLASPIYAFWARTVMIETTALFFALAWLAFFARLMDRPRALDAVGALFCGSAAVLAKSTTFPAFTLVAFALMLGSLWPLLRQRSYRAIALRLVAAGFVTLLPLVLGSLWVHFTDVVKLRSLVGSMLTSANLSTWNFGTWEARFEAKLWIETVFGRTANDTFGALPIVAAIAILAGFSRRRYWVPTALCLVGFLAPFLLFTNLHTTHNYYQVANAVFALSACAVGVQAVWDRSRLAASVLLAVLVGSQLFFFHAFFKPEILRDTRVVDVYKIGQLVQEKVPPETVIVVIGQDWSSAVPYYAERRGLVLATWFPRSIWETLLMDPAKLLGDRKLGGIVDCGTQGYDESIDLIRKFMADREVIAELQTCRLLAGDQG